jgi:hypothetical protein
MKPLLYVCLVVFCRMLGLRFSRLWHGRTPSTNAILMTVLHSSDVCQFLFPRLRCCRFLSCYPLSIPVVLCKSLFEKGRDMESPIVRAPVAEREALRDFHVANHLKSTVYSPESHAAQMNDLPTDFPHLYRQAECCSLPAIRCRYPLYIIATKFSRTV